MWGRRGDSHPYRRSLAAVDETLVQLLAERERLGGDEPGVPDPDRVQSLAEDHNLDPILIGEVFRLLDSRPWRRIPHALRALGELDPRSVLSIMRTIMLRDAKCTITHAVQLGAASEVHMAVTLEPADDELPTANIALDLRVEGPRPYEVRAWGGGGGGRRYERRFIVVPELPDDLQGIRFILIPATAHEQLRVVDVTVDAPTPFGDQ